MSRPNAMRQAKRAGMSARAVWDVVLGGIRARGHYRPSELAAHEADAALRLRKVYGKRATRFLFEDRNLPLPSESVR